MKKEIYYCSPCKKMTSHIFKKRGSRSYRQHHPGGGIEDGTISFKIVQCEECKILEEIDGYRDINHSKISTRHEGYGT